MQKTILMLLAISLLRSLAAQTADTVALVNRQSMLNGKFFLDFPAAAMNQQRPVDIMSTDRNINEETRMVLDNGDERLVVFARELYNLADSTFEQQLNAEDNEQYGFRREAVYSRNGYLAVLSTPTRFDSTRAGILINALMLKSPDGTVSSVAAMISPAAYGNKAYYTALTQRIFRSFAPGTRVVELQAHKEKVSLFGTDKELEFRLPPNHYIAVDQKYDFQVIKIKQYTPYGSESWQGVTIYLGRHPSWFYPDYGFSKTSAGSQKGTFLGERVDWLVFDDRTEEIALKEQQIPADRIGKDLVVHMAIYGDTAEETAKLQQIVEEIALGK